MIFEAVEEKVGFEALNRIVHKEIASWVVTMAEGVVQSRFKEVEDMVSAFDVTTADEEAVDELKGDATALSQAGHQLAYAFSETR